MSTKTNLLRRQIRAAVQIHSHLASTGRFGPIPVLYDHEWQDAIEYELGLEYFREGSSHPA